MVISTMLQSLSFESGQTGLGRPSGHICQACAAEEISASHLVTPQVSGKLHASPECPESAESAIITNATAQAGVALRVAKEARISRPEPK